MTTSKFKGKSRNLLLLLVVMSFQGAMSHTENYPKNNLETSNTVEVLNAIDNSLQQHTVGGTITDSDGTPLPGANIIEKGTTNGVTADFDGNYTITVTNNAVLVFSYIGYTTKEISVSQNTDIDVILNENSEELGEVVVTALGMKRETKSLSYAMTEIKGDDISKVNSPNLINSIQGKVAGVQVNMGNSGPQSSQRIVIRGNSSLGSNNQPIFVIDGIIIDNEVTSTGQGQDWGNDLKNLNADDFESMSVLKGAAATALYGSRAANGVILIITKKGEKGKGLGVSVSNTISWEKVYDFPDLQNKYGSGSSPLWALNSDGTENRNISSGRSFGPRFDNKQVNVDGFPTDYSEKKDNLKNLYQTGAYRNTNVALTGGSDTGSFRFSYSNLETNGITLNNEFRRNSFSLNAQQDLSSRISVEGGFAYVESGAQNPTVQGGDGSPVYDFMYSVAREYDTSYWLQDKRYINSAGNGYNGEDPYQYSKMLYDYLENKYNQRESSFRSYLNVDIELADWLTFKAKADLYKLYTTNESKIMATGASNFDGSAYNIKENKKDQYKITGMLTATHSIDKFNMAATVAMEQWDTRSGYHNSFSQNGLLVPGLFDMTNSVERARTDVRYNTNRKRINSVYAFANFDYKGLYYLDITGRNDWSSSLVYSDGSGNNSYFYPSAGFSWLFVDAFKEAMPDFISFGKLRASYAIVGSDTDPYVTTATGFYQFKDTFINPQTGASYPYYEFDSSSLPNNDLKPEKQHSIELGMDMRFFNNRLGFDIAWYKTNTKNQILALPMASETGVSSRYINAGNLQNSGVELLVNGTPIYTDDFRWDLSFNLTRNRNKIISLSEGVDKYQLPGGGVDTQAWATVGGAYGDIYTSYAYDRNDAGEKLLNSDGSYIRSGKSVKIGSLQPKFLWGANTSFSYKGVSLNAVVDARFGGDIFSGSYNYGMSSGNIESSLIGRDTESGGLPRTLPDGRTANDGIIPEGVFKDGTTIDGSDVSGISYRNAVENGVIGPVSAYQFYDSMYSWGNGIRENSVMESSWVALREISLSWSIPKKWTKQISLQSASVGIMARNLGYLYNSLPDNIHPEGLATIYSSEYLEAGGAVYSRNIGFTVKMSF
tara:strand:- start:29492 stop:32827 length:3336 start_codon:yes stop_codon:yes gene_type:complete